MQSKSSFEHLNEACLLVLYGFGMLSLATYMTCAKSLASLALEREHLRSTI